MNKSFSILMAAVCWLTWPAMAQDTNSLKTDLGVFETQTGIVLIKGFGQVGSLSVGSVEISVRCKESTDMSSGRKVYGLSIRLADGASIRERVLIDYDELDSLLSGINYLGKITYDVTSLPAFEASYSTKAGLRFIASSIRRQGGVQTYLQYDDDPKILLNSDQLTQLYRLIEQGKKNLDDLKKAK